MWRLALILLLAAPAAGQTVLRVDAQAPPGGDGHSWTAAFSNLQYALAAAGNLTPPVEVWVAAGTYRADHADGDPDQSFELLPGLRLLGGFAGTEDQADQRDWTANISILDGDLDGNDLPEWVGRSDNSRHIMTAFDLEASATVDGFTVRGGHAATEGEHLLGGGALFIERSQVYVSHCTFVDNWAGNPDGGLGNFGGAIYLKGDGALEVRDSRFEGNRGASGGAIGVLGRAGGLPSLRLYDCQFIGNEGRQDVTSGTGGAIRYASGEDVTIVRCTFEGNDADYGGAVFTTLAEKVLLRDSTFHANTSDARAVVWLERSDALDRTPAVIERCIFTENRNTWGAGFGSALYLEETIGHVWHCQFVGNDNYRYHPDDGDMDGFGTVVAKHESGHQFVNCLFADNHAAYRTGLIIDSATAIVASCTFADNAASRDDLPGAGLFLAYATVIVDNSIFWGNRYGTGHENEFPGIEGEDAQIVAALSDLVINNTIVEGWTGDLGGEENFGLDPLFADPAARNYRLQMFSPAIDVGDDRALPDELWLDLDGNPRLADGDGDQITTVDLGGYEYQPDATGVPVETVVGDGPEIRASQGAGRSMIHFRVPAAAVVRLSVHDLRGRRVAVLVDEWRDAGEGTLLWNGTDHQGRRLPSGTYLLHMRSGRQQATGRVLLVR